MKTLARSIFVFLTLFLFSAAQADRPVTIHYTGIGFNTSFDAFADPTGGPPELSFLPIGIIRADSFGSFGDSDTTIVYEFGTDYSQGRCETEVEVEFPLQFAQGVITFANHSQLLVSVSEGWMCLNTLNGQFTGGVTVGEFLGGTGKFARLTGSFSGPFWGQNMMSPGGLGLIAISGTIEGSLAK